MSEKNLSEKISSLIDEMKQFKVEHANLWLEEYADLQESLGDILDIIGYNELEAQEMFERMDVNKYDSFRNYVYNMNNSAVNQVSGTNIRSISTRAKRKNRTCPLCGGKLKICGSTLGCSSCTYVHEGKLNSSKAVSDNTKHTSKQLDNITGIKKPPNNIAKIMPHVVTWLTDLRYIYEWLEFNGTTSKWIDKYNKLTEKSISNMFFRKEVIRSEEYAWDYDVYKLFTDEFYIMTQNAKRWAKLDTSRMESLDDDTIYEIMNAYFVKYQFRRFPDIEDTFLYNDVEYDVGLYVNTLSLQCDEEKSPIKRRLMELCNNSMSLPGLMFNFRQLYTEADNLPAKYNYTQEYVSVIHQAFHVPFIDMDNSDKDAIVQLMLKFNDYYKSTMRSVTLDNHNAPLYCCVLTCVVKLPYFRKYLRILQLIPRKENNTSNNIKSVWDRFVVEHSELVQRFMEESYEEEDNYDDEEEDVIAIPSNTDVVYYENDNTFLF